jgi:hypothetical protein
LEGIVNPEFSHQAKPVHSLLKLQTESVVSKNIRQFNVYENGLIIAGNCF